MAFRDADDIIEDTEKGASELASDAAGSLVRLKEKEAREYLLDVLDKRYSMAPLVNLINDVFLAMGEGGDWKGVAQEYRERLKDAKKEVVEEAVAYLEERGYSDLLTLSYSSTVVNVLKDAAESVTVLESRPLLEGRKTAQLLSDRADVELWVDAGMDKALCEVEAVVVGADSIGKSGFVNKLGTRPIFVNAREREVPRIVVCDSSKFLPAEIPLSTEEQHPAQDVWDVDKVKVHNDYFEYTPFDGSIVITEEGAMSEKEIDKRLEGKEVSPFLLKHHPLVTEI